MTKSISQQLNELEDYRVDLQKRLEKEAQGPDAEEYTGPVPKRDIQKYEDDKQAFMNNNFFCYMPWTMVYSEVTGNWQTCCHAAEQTEMNVENTSPEEWMKSEMQQALRDEMLDPNSDKKVINQVCRRCVKEEKLYGESRRLRKLRNSYFDGDFPYRQDIMRAIEMYELTGEFEFEYRILESQVKVFGMQCNLDCHMCHPRHSTTRQKTQLKDGLMDHDIYTHRHTKDENGNQNNDEVQKYVDKVMKDRSKGQIEKLQEIAPYTYFVKVIGGEPLVMKKQYEYLQMLVDTGQSKHIQVKYQTNMTKLGTKTHKVIDFIPHFKRFTFTASLDSMGDAIEYCRRRTKWDEVLENIRIVTQFPNAKVDVNAVMGFLSVLRFYEFLEWVETQDSIEKPISIYGLEYPAYFQVKNLPEKIKRNLIPKYKGYPDIQAMLREPRDEFGDEESLQKTLNYFLTGDEYYKGTKYEKNLFEVFPELEEFYKPVKVIAKD